ncbi:hypothetical protein Droror1_Dr00027187 [Drosera rotundifolia]
MIVRASATVRFSQHFPGFLLHNGTFLHHRKNPGVGFETGQSQVQIQQPDSSLPPLSLSIRLFGFVREIGCIE